MLLGYFDIKNVLLTIVEHTTIFRITLSCANPWPLTAVYWKRQNTPCGTVFYKSYTTSGICRVCLPLFLLSSRTVTSVSLHFSIALLANHVQDNGV
jgi:hypothetical protein